MSKYCEQCGVALEENAEFCAECGTKCITDSNIREEFEKSDKENIVYKAKNSKKIIIAISGILMLMLILGVFVGDDVKSGQQLTLEEFVENDNELYGGNIRVEDFIVRKEEDGFEVRDKNDLFADFRNYTHYYYNNGATENYNNQQAVDYATAVRVSGEQRIFEVLVDENKKIKAIQSNLEEGDFATAQNLLKVFIPALETDIYPELRDEARKSAVAYEYQDGVAIEVTENFIRLWYETEENYKKCSQQQLLSEEEEMSILRASVGVWEQEHKSDLPVLDITMPSDNKLVIKQYYKQGTDSYGNEEYSEKECEINISDKKYADFSKDIEYTITNQKNEEIILRFVLVRGRTQRYTLPQDKSLECIEYIYDGSDFDSIMYNKTDKNMLSITEGGMEEESLEGDSFGEIPLENGEEYIFPTSNSEYIDKMELWEYSKEEIVLARNEIFARHGRIFEDENIRRYFETKDWYYGDVEPEEFDCSVDIVLNEFEKANIETFKYVEMVKDQSGNP